MLKLQPLDTTAQQYHIVIRVGQVPLRLVVQEVKGITQFTPDCLNLQLDLLDQSNALFTGMHSGAARDLAGTEC